MSEQQQPVAIISSEDTRSVSVFESPTSYKAWIQLATSLSNASMVPKQYQGKENVGNCLIALEIANRLKMSPLMVMQNLDIYQGKPVFPSAFKAALINSSPKYGKMEHEFEDIGEKEVEFIQYVGPKGNKKATKKKIKVFDIRCRAKVFDMGSAETLYGDWVSVEIAVKEGWYTKAGSKWPNMPRIMLRYRATSFWIRAYDPGLIMGIPSIEEVSDAPVEIIDEGGDIITTLNNTVADVPAENVADAEEVATDDDDLI